MLVMVVAIFIVSLPSVDPWVWFIAGMMALVLGKQMAQKTDQNLGLINSLAFATIIALLLALLFNFYTDDLGYRLKELGVSVACVSTAFAIVVSMTSHSRLELNTGMAILTTPFVALLLVTMTLISLFLFDMIAGNTLIVDNRWMMFIVTDIAFIVLGLWGLMALMHRSIPFDGHGEGTK